MKCEKSRKDRRQEFRQREREVTVHKPEDEEEEQRNNNVKGSDFHRFCN